MLIFFPPPCLTSFNSLSFWITSPTPKLDPCQAWVFNASPQTTTTTSHGVLPSQAAPPCGSTRAVYRMRSPFVPLAMKALYVLTQTWHSYLHTDAYRPSGRIQVNSDQVKKTCPHCFYQLNSPFFTSSPYAWSQQPPHLYLRGARLSARQVSDIFCPQRSPRFHRLCLVYHEDYQGSQGL